MATAPTTGTILPQYQGDYYALQNQQALAQALMQGSVQNQASQIPTNMPVVPKYNIGAGLAQLGQALLAGKLANQTAQGYRDLGTAQMGALIGTPAQGQQPPQDASLGQGASATPTSSVQPQAQASGGMLAPGGPMNPGGIPPQQAAYLYMSLGPTEYSKQYIAPYMKPTDATLAGRQGGFDPQAANRAQFTKDISIPLAPNSALVNAGTGGVTTAPAAAPPGYQNLQLANGGFATVPLAGGPQAVAGSAAAEEGGKGSQLPAPTQYDAQGNPLPTMSRTDAVNVNAPLGIRNNNPGNLRPQGQFAQYPDMETGIRALDANLQSYGKQGIDTLSGVIRKWAPPNENNTDAYIKAAAARLGIDPNQKIDLSNPLQRLAIGTAITLHENGPQGVFGQSAAYPAPPLAAQKNAEGLASGQIDTMQRSYQGLQGMRAGGTSALQDIDNMIGLSQGKNVATAGTYLAKLAGLTSANAAEYEKSRDNLVTNLGSQLGMNSDAARELVYGSIPSYGAPKQAIENGLQTLKGQVQMRMLKADYLSDAYAGGDAKTYNRLENQFDQNMTPKIAGIVAQPPSPQRAQALVQAAKDPQVRARLEWAAQNGLLK
jgi:hypothetical protein